MDSRDKKSAMSGKRKSSVILLLSAAVLGVVGVLSVWAANTLQTQAQTSAKQYPTYPTINYGTGTKASQIKQGEYLAKAGDCIACHTTDGGKSFAGGLPIKTPFGTIYTPNITPDEKTGIGTWTDQDFITAMREGISPSGKYYYPAFPYPYFNKLSDQDILDIKAYIDALPKVEQPNLKNQMVWPFSWRFLQLGWRILFFYPNRGQFQADSQQSAEWNRGKYLVDGLGHCSMCHSPMYYLFSEKLILGAPIKKYYLTGGFYDGYFAPNITSSTMKNVPVQTIVNVFLKNQLVTGGSVLGPMLEVNRDSLHYLSQDDLEAIATYIKTVKSATPPQPKLASGSNAGEAVYNKYCVGCHGTGAGGAPKVGDASDWAPKIALGIPTLYKNAINGIGGMPPKGTCSACTDTEIQETVDYMVDGSKPAAGETISAKPISKGANTSLAEGKKVYDQVCSICHKDGLLGAPKVGDESVWAPLVAKNMDVLFEHAINGYKGMPARGACYKCSDAEIIAAVKYMAQESSPGNYSLW